MPIRIILLLVVAPLFLLAGYFAYSEIAKQRELHVQAGQTAQTAREDSAISDVIHEVQKERGYSVGYVSSDGLTFPVELTLQRDRTDQVLASALSGIDLIATEHRTEFDHAVRHLQSLQHMRRRIDKGSGPDSETIQEVISAYSSLIDTLVALARASTGSDKSTEYHALRQARFLISSAKEKAGLERAIGAAGIVKVFSLSLQEELMSLRREQLAMLSEAGAVKGSTAWLPVLQRTRQYIVLRDLHETVVAADAALQTTPVTRPQWITASTAWIDLLRLEEAVITAELVFLANQLEQETASQLTELIWFSLFAALSAATFVVVALK
ncbi:nitrate- and nitrite sensing domain-containing protein [Phaeobacter gallaeciensis]|uniref:Nitrate and nitrite sensing n=1 Tax=Phaeobacter gallaeciensis TaxID=60890 RepID=A0AAC9Z6V5_9RHOB|nr:nitrate- and nitrite sensing domain-containing protein [Phaeobacter gallaeciensis]AHD08464.1 Nitrate and nitrite sensing [Phaeobacter gallaeciensis DSM 26640]ATE91730.1 Nitrate and nitrite sensing [Phaeobacter gallaeciensis]ATE98446.1 Nitrate and nitrite sensing [Phaeobacter gallaeciensis]ATF00346.1 Nitrate and nitrite sensing [Phaeobacter gallaeciensis]ATF04778.1 Nitrate and nitrite sensing [Phaeobacter gallaeciensis]